MDVYHLNGHDGELDGLVERVVAGEAVEIMRDGQAVAVMLPAQASAPPMDWDALRALTDSLPFDAQSWVVDMRRNARY